MCSSTADESASSLKTIPAHLRVLTQLLSTHVSIAIEVRNGHSITEVSVIQFHDAHSIDFAFGAGIARYSYLTDIS